MEFTEIQIPVPWGYTAAKIWGDKHNQPILMVHGYLDNAGSFNLLIPHLPKSYCYICIELPGHGRSSRLPQIGSFYMFTYLLVYKAVFDYFDYARLTIIGHSYGAILALNFAQLYPKLVERLVLIDALNFECIPPEQMQAALRRSMEGYESFMKKVGSPPRRDRAVVLNKIMNERFYRNTLPQEGAECLLDRIAIPTDDGRIEISQDPLLKFVALLENTEDYLVKYLKVEPVECPVLILLASESMKRHKRTSSNLMNLYKQQKNFNLKILNGSHEVHMENPKMVAKHINKFLLASSKL